MRILLCHCYYQQRGGEDESFDAEMQLLRDHGHEVKLYCRHNNEVDKQGRLSVALRAVWNRRAASEVSRILDDFRPEVMHCTNTFPLISPAVYSAAQEAGVPVVQALRNWRMVCANAFCVRNGRECEDCVGRWFAWPAVWHRCYRGSRLGSAVVAGVSSSHRLLGTWQRKVDCYYTLTDYARAKFIEYGIPEKRIFVKPNFLEPDPGMGPGNEDFVVFVGRLAAEKGVDVLLRAWQSDPRLPALHIVGDGPMAMMVRDAMETDSRITWRGHLSLPQVLDVVGEARLLVMPSVGRETFGRTILEAFSRGTPVLASRKEPLTELVDEGRTGGFFETANPVDLARSLHDLVTDEARLLSMRSAARREYLAKYTGEPNHERLLQIYHQAVAGRI